MRHPGYNGVVSAGNDVALIFLPVGQQITTIDPVRLNRNRDVPVSGQNLEVFGWGLTSNAPNPVPAIEIQTAIVQAVACIQRPNDILCAKTPGVAVGSGDSGT